MDDGLVSGIVTRGVVDGTVLVVLVVLVEVVEVVEVVVAVTDSCSVLQVLCAVPLLVSPL